MHFNVKRFINMAVKLERILGGWMEVKAALCVSFSNKKII
jgi:hypothetical protein